MSTCINWYAFERYSKYKGSQLFTFVGFLEYPINWQDKDSITTPNLSDSMPKGTSSEKSKRERTYETKRHTD